MIKSKRIKRMTAISMLTVLLALTGCTSENTGGTNGESGVQGGQSNEKSPITLQLTSDNALFTATIASGEQSDPVMKEIQKKTGVTLKLDTQTDDKKFNAMLAGGDLPDILVLQNSQKYLTQLIEGNQVIPMDDLLEKYGGNLLKESPQKIKNSRQFFSNGTGKLYAIPGIASQLVPQFKYASPAYNIRWDYYKELNYPPVNNMDDFLNLLAEMQKKHPVNEQGQKVYGMAPLFDWGLVPYELFDRFFNRINRNNMFVYLEPETFMPGGGILDPNVAYWQGTAFYRKANQLGVLDPDSFTQKYDNFTEKVKSNRVLFSQWQWAGPADANVELAKKNPTSGWMPMPMPQGQTVYAGEFGSNGFSNRLFMISKNCKYPERAMELISYLQSVEGSRLILNGIQGENWDVLDGKPQWKKETIDAQKNDPSFQLNTGIGLYWNLAGFVDGYQDPEYNVPFNYTLNVDFWKTQMTELDKDYSQHYGVAYPGELVEKRVEAGEIGLLYYDMDNELGMDQNMPDDIKRIETNVTDYLIRMAPKLIYAKTDEEYAGLQESMMEELRKMDAEKAVDYWMDTLKKAAETFASTREL
ncbi:extracellular solute-binding protein [Paenibacillus sp. J5C_2022]|uniref:extracellular solute-binding protein n=1 Tax=Paenibacillus sp. J5C2022 TaxID=2977129 RepID=UPI0021D39F84|nr:extracellular solute-binding protein [Paenibacillus sp. J5C2022]MCU6711364.1 extracellular solute-binding protein [Paenibacillus sp. J5C2022]